MNAIFDQESIAQVVHRIESVEKEQLNLKKQLEFVKIEFDKLIIYTSSNAQAVDDLREIQCIVDEAKRIELSVQVGIHNRIRSILGITNRLIVKIQEFQHQYCHQELIPNQVFNDIKHILKNCSDRLNEFQEILNFITKSVVPLKNIQVKIEKDSNKDTLRIWADAIEILAEGIEELLNLCPETPLGIIEDFAKDLLLIADKSNYDINKKEGFRRRVRYSAIFILNLVKKKRLDYINETSAETKAIARNHNTETIEWITEVSLEESINIEEISNFF